MRTFTRRITVLMTLVALLSGAASCMKKGASGKPSNVDYYTCTMHPSVHSKDPGKCPVCSMDLVPVMKKGGTEDQASASSPQPEGMKDLPGMKGGEGPKAG